MDPQALIAAIEHQRNAALNENAQLIAGNLMLQKENEALKKKLSELEQKE